VKRVVSVTAPGPAPPDYQGGSLINLMSSIIQGLGGVPSAGCPPLNLLSAGEITEARTVVLLLVDGMGDHLLSRHGRVLQKWRRGTLTSVFPTSTAPAITTLMTGEPPSRHGITGWFIHLRELATTATFLTFRPRWGGESFERIGVDPQSLIGAPPVFQRFPVSSHLCMPGALVDTPYTRAMGGAAERLPYNTLEECLSLVTRLARSPGGERRYIYAYWPRLDSLCHLHGSGSHEVATQVAPLAKLCLQGRFFALSAAKGGRVQPFLACCKLCKLTA
jgi:hypothetical protein